MGVPCTAGRRQPRAATSPRPRPVGPGCLARATVSRVRGDAAATHPSTARSFRARPSPRVCAHVAGQDGSGSPVPGAANHVGARGPPDARAGPQGGGAGTSSPLRLGVVGSQRCPGGPDQAGPRAPDATFVAGSVRRGCAVPPGSAGAAGRGPAGEGGSLPVNRPPPSGATPSAAQGGGAGREALRVVRPSGHLWFWLQPRAGRERGCLWGGAP